jgi:tripartite-type tricarboxylate transporter receptor subunit TctC
MFSRRHLSLQALGALALGLCLPVSQTHAQNFPSGTVRIIVPFPPGGATDVLGRVVAHELQALWGQSVVAEYKPGASGLLGSRQVATAPADGYTLLLASTGAILSLAASQNADANYRIERELSPVSLVAAPPYIAVVNPSVPVKNAAELVAYAKANPDKLTFGSSGVGSASHLSGALFAQMAGIRLVHVPYRGTGPAVTALLSGEVQMMFSTLPPVLAQMRAGRMRAIAVTGVKRAAAAPEVPTIAESGLPNYEAAGWWGVLMPGKTPPAIVMALNAEIVKVLNADATRAQLARDGIEAAPSTPEQFAAHMRKEGLKWSAVIKAANIQAE